MITDNERNLLDTQLIQLSYIFKNKFTIKVIDNKIIQYDVIDRPYDVKYKIIIEIKETRVIFKNGKTPDVCIIKGWFDKETDTYYIGFEL